jgi:hypothetical protein
MSCTDSDGDAPLAARRSKKSNHKRTRGAGCVLDDEEPEYELEREVGLQEGSDAERTRQVLYRLHNVLDPLTKEKSVQRLLIYTRRTSADDESPAQVLSSRLAIAHPYPQKTTPSSI